MFSESENEVELKPVGVEMGPYSSAMDMHHEFAAQYELAKDMERQENGERVAGAAARGRSRGSRGQGAVGTVTGLRLQGGSDRWEQGQVEAWFQSEHSRSDGAGRGDSGTGSSSRENSGDSEAQLQHIDRAVATGRRDTNTARGDDKGEEGQGSKDSEAHPKHAYVESSREGSSCMSTGRGDPSTRGSGGSVGAALARGVMIVAETAQGSIV